MRTELGKISSIKFGLGGYQDVQFGLALCFSFKGSGVNDFISGGWAMDRSDGAKWTEEDRIKSMGNMCMKIIKIMEKAKVTDITKLAGVPVECSFEGNTLKEWRVLEEVL